jgi:hypothetical protein
MVHFFIFEGEIPFYTLDNIGIIGRLIHQLHNPMIMIRENYVSQ